jgi:hypothetical protein
MSLDRSVRAVNRQARQGAFGGDIRLKATETSYLVLFWLDVDAQDREACFHVLSRFAPRRTGMKNA